MNYSSPRTNETRVTIAASTSHSNHGVIDGAAAAETEAGANIDAASPAALPYTRIALAQGTPEWLAWRQQGIGASDAPVVMKENPFKKSDQLIQEKLRGGGCFRTPKMALGVALEPDGRSHYSQLTGRTVEPVCLQSTQYPWLRASLDGLSPDGNRVVEIKCGRASYWATARSGRPPPYYVGQLQHLLAVTGLSSIDFVCYFPPLTPICITIQRDDDYIARLLRAERKFWNRLVALRAARQPMDEAA